MKRRYLTLGSLLLAASLAAVWWFGFHGIHPRLIFWPPAAEIPPPAALDETAEIDVVDMPLEKVLSMLATRHGVSIELDPEMVQSGLVTGNEPVTLKLSNVSLRSLLAHLAREFDLAIRTRRGEVYLTDAQTWAADVNNYVPRVYTLERLLSGRRLFNELEMRDLIETVVLGDSWKHPGGTGQCRAFPGGLVLSQTPEAQAEIGELLERLAELERAPTSQQPVWLDPPNARTKALFAALHSPAKLECENAPLADVVTQLSREHQVPILLDMRALDGVGVSGKTPITCDLQEIKLGSLLYHVLWTHELEFVVRDEAIVVTTPEYADRYLATRLYPIGDLLDEERGIDAATLENVILSNIAAHFWNNGGGYGKLKVWGGTLAISHTTKTHELIEGLLTDLRWALRQAPTGDSPKRLTPAEARLEKALAAKVSLKFDQTPLAEVAARLDVEHGVRLLFDPRTRGGSGVETDVPVTFEAENVPLETALRWMLAPLELAPVVIAETLSITTPDVAENHLETLCYRVGLLAEGHSTPNGGRSSDDFDALINAIEALIATNSWEDAGGAGVIDALGDVLVVSQTREIHARLADFLLKLQRTRPNDPVAAPVWVGEHALECYARLDKALSRRVNLDFNRVALGDVLSQLATEHKIPLVFDRHALTSVESKAGIFDRVTLPNEVDPFGPDPNFDRPVRPNEVDPFGPECGPEPAPAHSRENRALAIPVSCNFTNVTLRMGLEILLREHRLGYAVRHGRVEITSPDEAFADLRLRLYDVRDLAARFSSNRHPVDLENLLKKLIAVSTWDDSGGPGAICQLGNTLAVSQSPEVHRRIEGFLDKLRQQPIDPAELTSISIGDAPDAEQEAALARNASFRFADQPLGEVLAELAREHRLPLVIERRALEKLGVDLDQRVSYQREGGGVDLALDEILLQARPDNPYLGWRWRDGVLLVSDSDLLDRSAWIRLYPIPDLLHNSPEPSAQVRLPYYLEQLREARRLQARGTFDSLPSEGLTFGQALDRCLGSRIVDSDGTLSWWFAGNHLILASQRREILREMEQFLAQVRALRSNSDPAAKAGTPGPAPVPPGIVSVYDLRPLLQSFPELSETMLADWLHDQMRPKRRAERQNFVWNYQGPPSPGVWSGLLFVGASAAEDPALRSAIAFLAGLPADLPRPAGVARQDPQAVAMLVKLIDVETEPRRLDYVVWLAGRLAQPSEELIGALVRRLERTDPVREANLCAGLYIALGNHGPYAAAAVSLVASHIRQNIATYFQWLRVETLAALGPRGVAELSRLAVHHPGEGLLAQAHSSVLRTSPWKQASLETLLAKLFDPEVDRDRVLNVLNAVDPLAIDARELLDQWRTQDPDPERRRFAVAAEEFLKTKFGERQPKQ